MKPPFYVYNAVIDRVVDGDTFDATVDLGFDVHVKKRFRLVDIDTPETWRPKSPEEKNHGQEATAFAVDLIGGKEVILQSMSADASIYARWEANVFLSLEDYEKGYSLSDRLSEAGFDKKTVEEYLSN